MTNDDILDLHCLSALEQSGELPDGCDIAGFMKRRLVVEARNGGFVLTPDGTARLTLLRQSVD